MSSLTKTLLCLTLAIVLLSLRGCSTPQIGADEHTFNTVDALYTAVCGKRPDLVDQCERDLTELKSAGKIPAAAHACLTSIIAQTRQGDWKNAAVRLSQFMENQTGVAE
jgi:hypothetical protein